MKKIKLTILLCLVFVLAITAVACGSGSTTTKGTTEATVADTTPAGTTVTTSVATTTTPVTTEPTPPEKFTSLKIGETPLSEYTIVYARSEYYGYTKISSTKDYFPVYNFDRETADRLSDLIFEVSGIKLKVVEDMANKETANEILVGKTNRDVSALSLDSLQTDDYLIDVEGKRLVICGGEYGTTWHAIDYLEELFSEQLKAGKSEYAFATDYTYKGNHHLIQIGCIGDSITEGYNASDRNLFSYSAQLGRYLWKDALVSNFGSSGATMRNDLDRAYTKREVYTNALNAAPEMDIFTIMLGTNDSYFDQSWSTADSESYVNSCLYIMEGLTQRNKDLQFVFMSSPRYFGSGGWLSATVRKLQTSLPQTLNDAGYPTTFFDMYSASFDLGEYFPDQIHPNNKGHMLMAEAFSAYLNTLITK